MQFIDLKAQYGTIEEDVNRRIKKVLEHGQFILGPEVRELEECLAEYVGVKNCIGVSNGTDALLIAMMALGIGQEDEVVTTAFSFIAAAEMIALIGASPVFVDIDPRTYNMDPNLLEAAITPKTKAIIPVSLYGQCADMDRINHIAKKHGIAVIEDGAQSFGATYKGKKSCSLTDIACTSFFPSKPLGAYGDAGACFTDDDSLAKAIREISHHGEARRYHHARIGVNGRLDTLQAAILLSKMEIFPREVEERERIGKRYTALLADADVITPYVEAHNTSVYAQYTIRVKHREEMMEKFKKMEIPFAIHYPVPLTRQPVFSQGAKAYPVADSMAENVMSLPMHPLLSDRDQEMIIEAIKQK